MTAIALDTHPLTRWDGPLGLPDFPRITDDDFAPVFEAALAVHSAEIATIANNPASPTIENTLAALELSGEALERVSAVFWLRAGADTSDRIQALEREIAPKIARHYADIHMNPVLFERLDALYRQRDALDADAETLRALEKTWKGFVRAGAALDDAGKARLARISEELALLGARFGQNVLADERDWLLLLDAGDLAGLPGWLVESMAEAARLRGHEGRYAVTLSRSLVEPFLAFSERRDLREAVLSAFLDRGARGGETDNAGIVTAILRLRAEKARLLGYETFAAWRLDNAMAKTPQAVFGLLEPVWRRAREKAAADEAALKRIAALEGANHALAPWDWRYYAEKLKAERHDFDEAALKPYLTLDGMIAAAFDVAGRLFGLTFEARPDIAAWHPDVRVFEVRNAEGERQALFLADYFARPSKRSGAWMGSLQVGHRLGVGAEPIVYNVMNFARPRDGHPALLSVDEARTLFHEFGHALHGMLSGVRWPSLSGTAVARDFVELPSQLFEHWLHVPEILSAHARHHVTGESIPATLVEKMQAARTFDSGFATVEFAASALVDMTFHVNPVPPEDPIGFERETLARLEMPASIAMRHRTPHFLHVFSGEGYAAGYYSYLWSEVLDADAFAAFEEAGDPFDPELAERLRRYIYAAGDSDEPETLYRRFRGRMPTPEAMMRKRGLLEG
jgi:peptidyl-dipeptidase Dcp